MKQLLQQVQRNTGYSSVAEIAGAGVDCAAWNRRFILMVALLSFSTTKGFNHSINVTFVNHTYPNILY